MHYQALTKFIDFLLNHQISRWFLRLFLKTFSPKKDIKIKVQGKIMYARTLDRIVALYLRKHSFLERKETELFKSLIKKGMTIVDVGANLGYYTLIGSELVGKEGRVFAFEPDPENFHLLLKNIEANGCDNIEVVNKAVSDKNSQVQLFLCEESSGGHRIYDSGLGQKSIRVLAVSLDNFFANSLKIDLVKIDVEGSEPLVFSGMEKIIAANPEIVIIAEFWPYAIKKAGFSPQDFLKKIESKGLSIYLVNEDTGHLTLVDGEKLIKQFGKSGESINLLLTNNKI